MLRLCVRYEFVCKLGWAASSSVWLALSAESRTFVALKILTSQATAQVVGGHSPEYDVYKKIWSTNPNSSGFRHCFDCPTPFTAKSASGGHTCFVMDACSSLATLRLRGRNRFTVSAAKRTIKQVLLPSSRMQVCSHWSVYSSYACRSYLETSKIDNILVEITAASQICQ